MLALVTSLSATSSSLDTRLPTFSAKAFVRKNINIILINTNIGTKNNHLFQLGYKVNNQLIEKDWSPSSTSTPHWSTLTSTTKRNLCLSNIWSQVSEGFDGQTRTELLEAGNELDRVRILKTISCQSFTTCSTSPQLWEQQIPIYVDTHYLWKQKIPKYVDTD